jgi:hypothetical protein
MGNIIKDRTGLLNFRDDRLKFIVSSRRITPDVSIMDYLKIHYIFIKPEQITHVFGSVTINSRLYGGRKYNPYNSLNEKHIRELYDNGIGISLNLTNHFFDKRSYEESLPLLEKLHSPKNSVIITNDELAKNIKKDFPYYKLKASIIKDIKTLEALKRTLQLYDYVTIPMEMNDDDDFLNSIPQKEKVILFANANCAYSCPTRTCYYGFSQYNRGEKMTSFCSRGSVPRLDTGPVYFDLRKLADMGFSHFKLVPSFGEEADYVTKQVSWTKETETNYYKKPEAFIVSYPKSGRTWLRFILANYINSLYNLNMNINLHNFFHLLPNDTNDEIKGFKGFNFYNNDEVPLILFSHKKYNEIGYRGKTIFLLRSPYDIMVSDYFQETEHLGHYKGSINDFIRDEDKGIKKLCNFLNDWAAEMNNEQAIILSYEELSENTYKTVEKFLRYLDIAIDKNKLQYSIKKSNFAVMQEAEKQMGLPSEKKYNLENSDALRMREGKTGNYNKYLNTDDVFFINSVLIKELNTNVLKLLKEHGCIK